MSNDHVLKTIEMVQAQVRELEQQLAEKKRVANDLCKLAGQSPCYSDAELVSGGVTTSIRSDEFYGKALASVVHQILEKRAAAGLWAASVNDIYDAMKAGGYLFTAKSDENAKRGLYISLGKNTTTFHKLPNGNYGLLAWYPEAKKENGKKSSAKDETTDDQEESSGFSLDDVGAEK